MFRAFIDCNNGFACVSLSLKNINREASEK